jgi:hypothetical protein
MKELRKRGVANARRSPEVVVGTVDVRWDDRRVVAAVLLVVADIHHVDHALCVGIASIGTVRWPIVHHCLINGVRCLIWEYAVDKDYDGSLVSSSAHYHVDKHDTSFSTLNSRQHSITLSLINTFSR